MKHYYSSKHFEVYIFNFFYHIALLPNIILHFEAKSKYIQFDFLNIKIYYIIKIDETDELPF